MNDKLKQIYDLYLDQGIITEKVSFDMFASADDSKMQQLYDLGKERGLFKSINSSTFKSAWEVKKKETQEIQDSVLVEEPMVTEPEEVSSDISEEDRESFSYKSYLKDILGGAYSLATFSPAKFAAKSLGDIDYKNIYETGVAQGAGAREILSAVYLGKDIGSEEAKQFAEAANRLENIGPSDAMIQFDKDYEEAKENYGGALGSIVALGKNPEVATETVLTSMIAAGRMGPEAIPELLGSTLVGAEAGLAIGGPAGIIPGAAGGLRFGVGAILDGTMSMIEFTREELGEKPFTPENIQELFQDEERFKKVRNRALARGLTIGTIEAFAGAAAGKIAKPIAKVGIEAAGGGIGEIAARAAASQEMDAREILLETVGGLAGAPATLIEGSYKVNKEPTTAQQTEQIIDEVDAKDLRDIDITIENDYNLSAKYNEKIQKQKISEDISPDVPEENREQVIDLEYQRKQLEGKKTVSAKEKVKQIDEKIKELSRVKEENIKGEEVIETEPTYNDEIITKTEPYSFKKSEVIFNEDGSVKEILNKKTGNPVTVATRSKVEKKILQDVIDVDAGKKAPQIEGITEGEIASYIAENSENVREVAESIKVERQRIKDAEQKADEIKTQDLGKESLAGETFTRESWESVTGNAPSENISSYWIRSKEKGGKNIKDGAKGFEADEIVNFILDYPNAEALKVLRGEPLDKNDLIDLENKFQKITGIKATDSNIETVINAAEKLTREPESLIEESYQQERVRKASMTEEEYYDQSAKLDKEAKIDSKNNEKDLNVSEKNTIPLLKKLSYGLKKINSIRRKYFTSLGRKERSFRFILETLDNNLRAAEYRLKKKSRQVVKELKDIAKNKKSNFAEAQEITSRILKGAYLTPEQRDAASKKGYIKLLNLADQMRLDIDAATDELVKVLPGIKNKAAISSIQDNIGFYVNRSYRLFQDPNYKPSQKSIDNFKNYMIENASDFVLNSGKKLIDAATEQSEKNNISIELAINRITDMEVDSYLNERSDPFVSFVEGKGIDSSVLKRLKNVPPEMREFYGEYTDPLLNYVNTVVKINSLSEKIRFQKDVLRDGLGKYIFEANDVNRDTKIYNVKIAGEKSERFSPLAGLYTSDVYAEVLSPKATSISSLLKTALEINSFVKGGKTVYSIASHPRNYISNAFLLFMNGHVNLKDFGKANSLIFREIFTPDKTTKEQEAIMEKYYKLGVAGQSVQVGEFRASAESINPLQRKSFLDGINKRLQQMAKKQQKAESVLKRDALKSIQSSPQSIKNFMEASYMGGDDIFKITAFEVSKKQLIKAEYGKSFKKMSDKEKSEVDIDRIEKQAAELIKDLYPTYDRVPAAYRAIGRFPLTGSFVSFTSEIFRTAANSYTRALEMTKSDNKGIRELGKNKLKTAAVYTLLKSALYTTIGSSVYEAISNLLPGEDEDDLAQEEKDLRMIVAPWSKNSKLAVFEKSNGKITYVDLSSNDAHGVFTKMIQQGLNEDNFKEAVYGIVSEMISPFTDTEILTQAILEINNNKKRTGGNIYDEKAPLNEKVLDISAHLWKAAQPGTISSISRITDKDRVTKDELIGLTGFRPVTINLEESFMYKVFKARDEFREIKSSYRNSVRDGKDQYDFYNELYKKKMLEFYKIKEAYVRQGMNDESSYFQLKKRLSKNEYLGIYTGAEYDLPVFAE